MKKKILARKPSEQVFVEATTLAKATKAVRLENFDVAAQGLDKGFSKFESIARSFESNVLKKGLSIQNADLELGISFTTGGSIIFVKGEIGASLIVRIHFE